VAFIQGVVQSFAADKIRQFSQNQMMPAHGAPLCNIGLKFQVACPIGIGYRGRTIDAWGTGSSGYAPVGHLWMGTGKI
jgi:hypothetical protein